MADRNRDDTRKVRVIAIAIAHGLPNIRRIHIQINIIYSSARS